MSIGFKQNPDGSWYSYKIIKNNPQPAVQESLPDLSSMTVEQLKAFANENNIELASTATTKPVILSEIQKAWDSRAV